MLFRGQKWQEKDIRNSYLSPDINFWCFLSIFGCFSVIPASFRSSVVLSVNIYIFVNITQGWLLARAEFSRINHRKSAVSSLQILQSPLDLTQGRIQSSSNYCFPPLDQSDHRAQISARIIHVTKDSFPSKTVDDALPRSSVHGRWKSDLSDPGLAVQVTCTPGGRGDNVHDMRDLC